jgi:hypothetical protein
LKLFDYKKIKKNVLQLIIFSLDNGARLIGTLIYQLSHQADNVALIFMFVAWCNIFSLFSSFFAIPISAREGFHSGKGYIAKKLYGQSIFYFLLGLFLFLIPLGLLFFKFKLTLIITFVLNVFFISWLGFALAMLKAQGRVKEMLYLRFASSLLYLFVSVISSVWLFDISLFLMGLVASSLIPVLFAHRLVGEVKEAHFKMRQLTKWLKLAVYKYKSYVISSGFFVLMANTDRIIIGKELGSVQIAGYAFATTIAASILLINNLVLTNLYSSIVARKSTTSFYKLCVASLLGISLAATISLLVYVGMDTFNIYQAKLPQSQVFYCCLLYFSLISFGQTLFFYAASKSLNYVQYLPYILTVAYYLIIGIEQNSVLYFILLTGFSIVAGGGIAIWLSNYRLKI